MLSTLYGEYDNSLVSNNFGFLRFPLEFNPHQTDADWVITGFTFDVATSGRPGARFGPEAIRKASVNLAWEGNRFPWDFNLRERLKVVDCGDLTFAFGDNAEFCDKAEQHVTRILQSGKKMLSFGGDHFITLPLLRGHFKKFGQMALLHFDAHTDTYDHGSDYDHGTMFYHAPKEGLIDPEHSIQIGIRTEHDPSLGYTVLDAPRANDMTVTEIVQKIKQVTQGLPIYLTFDIDCLDPAYAPGTGTPVCGGMSTDKIFKILRGLKDLNIIGMDVVEVAPSYDQSDITALAAATIALEMFYLQASKLK
ncbi:agmatinase [Neisseriaceae bacterium PsAf]|nr:agmatinase [Neisseriaceae bacterium PsAf]MCV2502746.1 agmatinase [Neisseriaceae bacterium]